MIGLDTNVLVRCFVRDDRNQAERAAKLMNQNCTPQNPGFISLVTLIELMWVLRTTYEYEKSDVVRLIRSILETQCLMVELHDRVWRALHLFEQGKADFSDYLIACSCSDAGAAPVYTFDRRAIQSGGVFQPVP